MRTKQVVKNKHDCRRGFQENTFKDWDEQKAWVKENNRKARKAHDQRLKDMTGKPRLSVELAHCQIPQSEDIFVDPIKETACALGAIQVIANDCSFWAAGNEPDWWEIRHHFDVYEDEWSRNVKCPECRETNSLSVVLYHLNDVHKYDFPMIGEWLAKYDL